MNRVVLVIFAMMFIARAQGQTSAPTIEPKLLEQLVEIDKRASAVSDLSADFTQRKITPLLRKPLVSSGTLRIKGSAMFWDTKQPEPTRMRIDEKEVRLYYPKQETLEIYTLDQRLGSLAASPLPRLDVLRKHFAIERGEAKEAPMIELKLTPIEASLKQHVERVVVLLDARQGLIVKAEVTDADGDRTSMEFTNVKTNTKLGEDEVRLEIPENTKIVRPLEGLER
jgi:outer membrane lipoprotein-sorting protein